MRPIKFRAYNTMENRMYWLDPIEYPFQSSQLIEAPAWKLMQFTGLLDKNGKEIYERDIVRLEGWNPSICEVVFDRGAFCIRFKNDDMYYPDIKYVEGNEVIGNIYEHPELLSN